MHSFDVCKAADKSDESIVPNAFNDIVWLK
jgi:hypothetical protein